VTAEKGSAALGSLLEAYERSVILAALATVGGRQRSAAQLLRILPSTLHEKMKRLGIRPQRRREAGAAPGPEVRASLRWSGSLPPGGTLEVRGLNGPVRIEGCDDGPIEVSATRRGPRSAFAAVEVKVVEHRGGVTVCAVCEGLDPSAPARFERRLSRGVASVRIDVAARVPPGVNVIASTINDDVLVLGLASRVEALTANGRVRIVPAAALCGPDGQVAAPAARSLDLDLAPADATIAGSGG
jgi:hypothetical protein